MISCKSRSDDQKGNGLIQAAMLPLSCLKTHARVGHGMQGEGEERTLS